MRYRYTPGTRVTVAWRHPRTDAPGMFNAHVWMVHPSGRTTVLIPHAAKLHRYTTDPANMRARA